MAVVAHYGKALII